MQLRKGVLNGAELAESGRDNGTCLALPEKVRGEEVIDLPQKLGRDGEFKYATEHSVTHSKT